MFIVREVKKEDIDSVYELAGHLKSAGYVDSFNLPFDKKNLAERIEKSVLSFKEKARPKKDCIYMFVLEDIHRKKILGTSLIMAKHGTADDPHTYLKVLKKKHRDPALKIEKKHILLRFEYDTDGPSEIGGLILHPDYRGLPLGLGKQLSYSRFMYVSLFSERFEKNMIAELLPPFNDRGSSDLWDAFGRRFTDMEYQEADKLSREKKDFIKNLFPQEDIYTCLFDEKARNVIGETGPTSSPVRHMLEKIGFTYLDAVDPFDGGPHFGAKTSEITLIKRKVECSLSPQRLTTPGNIGLVGFLGTHGFGCLMVHHKLEDTSVALSEEAVQILKNENASLDHLHVISQI